jgi:putative hemolysin
VSDLLRILAVLGLVGANAFFVIGEYAIVTARRSALTPRAEAGSAGARAALRLMDDPVRVISTVQVGITAIGIMTGALSEPLVRDLLGGAVPSWLSFVIAFSTVTYLSVVFGELVPKALTLQKAETLAALVARPVEAIAVAFRPLVWVLQGTARAVLKPFGITEVIAGETIRSAAELRGLVDEAEESGLIPRAQEELLHNVFEFADREAADIMVPAHDMAWLDAALPLGEAIDQMVETTHTRYPVGRGSIDNIVGVIHARDVFVASRVGGASTVGDLARDPLVVPETKDVAALLRDLREQRQQLAIVVDEYGATAGIVSIEDVVEEIVGEIEDEFDLPDSTLEWTGDRTVHVAGSMTIDDFNESVGTKLPVGRSRTLAGLTFDELGRRPTPGDEVAIDGVRLRVEAVDGMRITKIEVTLPPEGVTVAP